MAGTGSNYDKQVDMSRRYFLQYDQELLARKYRLDRDEEYLYVTYLGQQYRIDRQTAAVELREKGGYTECRTYSVVMTIYDMLCHHKGENMTPLSGEWTPVGSFAAAGASPDANLFAQKYADAFSGRTEQLQKACERMGGKLLPRLAGADVTAELPAFAFFPVLFQFWEGDEEFSPQIRILWDRITMQYLHFETTYYLQGDLLDRLADILTDRGIPE